MTGTAGHIHVARMPNEQLVLLLSNFDVAKARLKPGHEMALLGIMRPVLSAGGSCTIFGMASRSGSANTNNTLSQRRAEAVKSALARQISPLRALSVTGQGESLAAQSGHADGSEDAQMRGVIVVAWPKPTPPDIGSVHEKIKSLPGPPGMSLLSGGSIALDVLDGVGLALSVSGLLEVGTVGAAGVAAAAAEILGPITAIAALHATVFATLIDGDNLAETNAELEGFWNAMEDMARQYDDRNLDRKPMDTWPPVVKPNPRKKVGVHLKTVAARRADAGEHRGIQKAHRFILDMDSTPQSVTVEVKPGQSKEIKVTGRLLLRMLQANYAGRVADELRERTNAKLRAEGKQEWPFH